MNEVTRALVIVGAVSLGLVSTWVVVVSSARLRRRSVRTDPLHPWPAVVLFTSTDCDACGPVRDTVVAHAPDQVFREVSYQGNADLFRSAGVGKVPAVVLIDGRGTAVAVFEGDVRAHQMRRALRRAGIR